MCTVQKCASVQGKCEQLILIKYFFPPFLNIGIIEKAHPGVSSHTHFLYSQFSITLNGF